MKRSDINTWHGGDGPSRLVIRLEAQIDAGGPFEVIAETIWEGEECGVRDYPGDAALFIVRDEENAVECRVLPIEAPCPRCGQSRSP